MSFFLLDSLRELSDKSLSYSVKSGSWVASESYKLFTSLEIPYIQNISSFVTMGAMASISAKVLHVDKMFGYISLVFPPILIASFFESVIIVIKKAERYKVEELKSAIAGLDYKRNCEKNIKEFFKANKVYPKTDISIICDVDNNVKLQQIIENIEVYKNYHKIIPQLVGGIIAGMSILGLPIAMTALYAGAIPAIVSASFIYLLHHNSEDMLDKAMSGDLTLVFDETIT